MAPLTLDPLRLPSSSCQLSVNGIQTALQNFREAKRFYRQKVMEGNAELSHVYNSHASVQNVFRQIFPELVQSRGITMIEDQGEEENDPFVRWNEGNNDVIVELDDQSQSSNVEKKDAIFIGGPSTLTACLLYQLRYPDHRVQHLFADRLDSNFDGSAYYYHQRDAAPVYINRVNRGPFCIFVDLHKRWIRPEQLAHQAETDRHHVKISLNWTNMKIRYLWTIFVPNVWHMVNDLWLKERKRSMITHVIEHACRTVPIVRAISEKTKTPVETMLIHGKNKANYAAFAGSKTSPKDHFTWLNSFARLPFDEISRDGFGPEVVQVLDFPNDGLIAPMIIEHLQQQIAAHDKLIHPNETTSVSRPSALLTKLFVRADSPHDPTRVRVTSIEWKDTKTHQTHRMAADRVFLSLGPSGHIRIAPPALSWPRHALDVALRKTSHPQSVQHTNGGYEPTLASLWRHSLNAISARFFRGSYCLKDAMWASGSSSVILLGIDLSRSTASQLDVFSRFIDGVNQHWTLIAQRDVSLPLTSDAGSPTHTFRFFAIQMTGGGNFPSRLIRPDFVLNLLYTTEKMYGLDVGEDIVYDLIQSRGCGRAVSAQNTIAFQKLASNAVTSYALGGIGMTTMFANGEKMLQMIEEDDEGLRRSRQELCGETDRFLDGIDYSFLCSDSQLSRFLGFDNKMTKREKITVIGSAIALLIGWMSASCLTSE